MKHDHRGTQQCWAVMLSARWLYHLVTNCPSPMRAEVSYPAEILKEIRHHPLCIVYLSLYKIQNMNGTPCFRKTCDLLLKMRQEKLFTCCHGLINEHYCPLFHFFSVSQSFSLHIPPLWLTTLSQLGSICHSNDCLERPTLKWQTGGRESDGMLELA